jgi:hypothetical protein
MECRAGSSRGTGRAWESAGGYRQVSLFRDFGFSSRRSTFELKTYGNTNLDFSGDNSFHFLERHAPSFYFVVA